MDSENLVEEENEKVELSQLLFDTINTLFNNLFSSIDNSLYTLLDNIVFLDATAVITDNIQSLFFYR